MRARFWPNFHQNPQIAGATYNISREAAPECSPGRKPWVADKSVEAPNGAKE